MLRDEIARYTELSGNDGEHTPIGIIGAYLDGYEKGLESRENIKGEWIPVSERLPEKNRAVLVCFDTGATKTYCLAYWNDRVKGWEEWVGFRMLETEMGYKVLAWMPLPEPYHKGGE